MASKTKRISNKYLSKRMSVQFGEEQLPSNKTYYHIHNLWNWQRAFLIRDYISYCDSDYYYFYISFRHFKRRKISKVKVILFADHGPVKEVRYTVPNVELLKEKDFHRYNMMYREGNYYVLDIDVADIKQDNSFTWVKVPLDESVPIVFSTMMYHEQSFIDPDFFENIGLLTMITDAEVESLYTQLENKKKPSHNYQGTSFPEQAIFHFVRQFFPEAVNREKVVGEGQKPIEIDIYIPSIKIAIEYDGKYWHSRKADQDNGKNKQLNDLGLYVIRVRDKGLPSLDPFNGRVFTLEKSFHREPLISIITDIIHLLSGFLSKEKRQLLCEYSLTYDSFLKQVPSIEALLHLSTKENCFFDNSACSYWDYSSNGELDPKTIETNENVLAWFICPKGDHIIRPIKNCTDSKSFCRLNNTSLEFCIYSICPFLPTDGDCYYGSDCGIECPYVESLFVELVRRFVRDGTNERQIDPITINRIKMYPRVAYETLLQITSLKETDYRKAMVERVFFSATNIYNGAVTFISRHVRLKTANEIDNVFRFNQMYPNVFISFNWDVFDRDDYGREKLIDYLYKLKEEFSSIAISVYLNQFIRESNWVISEKLRNKVLTFAKEQNIFLDSKCFEEQHKIYWPAKSNRDEDFYAGSKISL